MSGAPYCLGMRILLVEDEPKLSAAIAKGLRHEGYAVDTAASGDDALLQARVYEYDAIVLDVMLPHTSGFAVCETLRRDGPCAPVLMLTARDPRGAPRRPSGRAHRARVCAAAVHDGAPA